MGLLMVLGWLNLPPALTHLFFADDVILFSKDDPTDVYQIISILNCFTNASGQLLNTAKSGLICGRKFLDDFRGRLTRMTSVPLWDNPGKYLGIPVEWGQNGGDPRFRA